jgi:hypothetical protein
VAGSYAVTASAAGATASAGFSLTNTAVVGNGGSLSGSATSSSSLVNLTTEGSSDWEHWGDGSLNRKAGVTPQLSNYALVGDASAISYNNDPRPVSWSDGTPTVSSANNLNGLYIFGVGNGFSFTAPAGTTPQTVVVHVGGWFSGGTLTAQLSDGSAPKYTNTTTSVNGSYDQNYTLTYSAGSAGQTLTVTWTMTSGNGNVTLNAAALSSSTGSIVASAGTPQSAVAGTAFAMALQAVVTNASGNPVSGATVTFTAPVSGASGTFGGVATATATTNADGVATAPAFTANATAGSYTVTAGVAGISTLASFNLTNTAVSGGSLSVSGNSSTSLVNLTVEGSSDWEHWGDSALNRKAGVAPQLSNYTLVGSGAAIGYNNDPRPVNWSDGTPTASSTNNENGLYISGVGNGFSLTAPAGTTLQTVVVHVGGWYSGGTLTAHLSDGSAPDYTITTLLVGVQYDQNYTLTYNAASAGQTLTITWTMASGFGNVTLNAAALE